MATSDERRLILRMVEEGTITATEGTRLLSALGGGEVETPAHGSAAGRFVRIRVTDTMTGQHKVSVNLPASLVTFGLRFVPESSGVDLQAIRDAIESGHTGRLLEVQDSDDGTRVEIFVE